MEKFDLIVIGGGSAGIAAANRAGSFGKNVLLIEGNEIGGTCVNVGCVPKKIMWSAAVLAQDFDLATDYGFTKQQPQLDFEKLVANRSAYIERLHGAYFRNLDKNQVQVIKGYAKFIDNQTVEVNGSKYVSEHILIATGGTPNIPDIPGGTYGIESNQFFDDLKELPAKVAVIGNGYIGTELAGTLNALGSKVHMYAKYGTLLPNFDELISTNVTETYIENGIDINFNSEVTELKQRSDGKYEVITNESSLVVDCVIWAVGRRPVTDKMNISATNIKLNDNGTIVVDEYQNTSVAGIYATGDVIGKLDLTPVAIAASRRLMERVFNNKPTEHLDYKLVPTVVFSHPVAGTIGLTESEAILEYGKKNLKIYRSTFTPMRYSLGDSKVKENLKLITVGEDERIVGLHGVGEGMDEMLQGFAVAIKMGATKKDFDDTVAIHPTSAEEFVTMT
ncbi:glutathione-disulfide reductase [Dellaglioa sp. P0083]|uniref:glutathione-disulfide reductase n=1 Tax=Dellaglioa kimchii TaxID=3344667 RepID=UPI0038D40BCA